MPKMSIREITRNFKDIDKYDYIEIEDKKTNTIKGIIVSGKYLDEIRAMIKKIIEEKKRKEIDEFMKFAGIVSGDTKDMSEKELRKYHASKYLEK